MSWLTPQQATPWRKRYGKVSPNILTATWGRICTAGYGQWGHGQWQRPFGHGSPQYGGVSNCHQCSRLRLDYFRHIDGHVHNPIGNHCLGARLSSRGIPPTGVRHRTARPEWFAKCNSVHSLVRVGRVSAHRNRIQCFVPRQQHVTHVTTHANAIGGMRCFAHQAVPRGVFPPAPGRQQFLRVRVPPWGSKELCRDLVRRLAPQELGRGL